MAEDYYSILGVPKTASLADIKTAYLKLAREKHPDRFKDPAERDQAAQRFQLVNEAFNLLRDEQRRRKYDEEQEWQKQPPEKRAEQHYKDGKYREQTGQFNEALKYYYEAVQVAPDNPTYKLAVARLLGKDRAKQRQAAEIFEEVISKFPDAREGYLELGELYANLGLHTRATRVYERGLTAIPKDPELQLLLSQSKASAKRSKK